jgi:hypothetical protein
MYALHAEINKVGQGDASVESAISIRTADGVRNIGGIPLFASNSLDLQVPIRY